MMHRIAIASRDGKMVNEHFGHARRFIIVDLYDDGNYFVREVRECINACGGDDFNNRMNIVIDKIKDCEAVFVCMIGNAAIMRLKERGIKAYVNPSFIEDVLKDYLINSVGGD
ncbi:dinitrogenase iron-molybdenum cofactor biosynthesis protein [Thermoanaerobacterium thermosaccharolyticum]|nr:dinitrogenase iron-molybdenum cofactor biosynthesis protein [Thermoanaerobacterium thermosaccharolyticum]